MNAEWSLAPQTLADTRSDRRMSCVDGVSYAKDEPSDPQSIVSARVSLLDWSCMCSGVAAPNDIVELDSNVDAHHVLAVELLRERFVHPMQGTRDAVAREALEQQSVSLLLERDAAGRVNDGPTL